MNIAYLRVSTEAQTTGIQKSMIIERGYKIDRWYSDDGISGAVSWKKRKIYQAVRKLNDGDRLIVAELSRLGRSLKDILDIVEYCQKKNVGIVCVREGVELSDNNPMTKLLLSVMGSVAELERNLIAQRTKDAMAKLKQDGVILGRQKGVRLKIENLKLYGSEDKIKSYLADGLSWTKIGEKLGCAKSTAKDYYERWMNGNI